MSSGIHEISVFDGLDNRRTLIDCFRRMGGTLPEMQAAQLRASWLQWVARRGGFSVEVTPCSPEEAYAVFLQITAHLKVPILEASLALEEAVR